MLPDQVSNPGPLTYESGALLIALCSPAAIHTTDGGEVEVKGGGEGIIFQMLFLSPAY